ncbi:MAG TPA: anacyclamide/piricyclamide family prenylated cyclic peptide [Actinophytocola sp.]|jgi:prenylated cyclic peptide (anacyclamide/piricyclamide family)|uniref:anacyclamide/piricyclamide family prenylated cyclic peptide n=1 Tax=Actinophytocola sp. TaxID=1872138 RepID=UPI002DFCDB9D|nr:anacyclamide/piricyclamide family prenylated cyclic peptide [Actinophytocola sp.]
MAEDLMSVAPQLARPVSRHVTGTVASSDTGVEQSIWGGIQWKDIPFAGDDDE